jgi:hypothetical protein
MTTEISMILVQNAALKLEVRELSAENKKLTTMVEHLQNILHVCEITKIYDTLAHASIYKSMFTRYRDVVLYELIARYQFTEIQGPVDAKVVVRLMNKIGAEGMSREGLKLVTGERIKFLGG